MTSQTNELRKQTSQETSSFFLAIKKGDFCLLVIEKLVPPCFLLQNRNKIG